MMNPRAHWQAGEIMHSNKELNDRRTIAAGLGGCCGDAAGEANGLPPTGAAP